ncbi:MAG: hypothetical protein ACOYOB_04300 [Myxococcota bacterium]
MPLRHATVGLIATLACGLIADLALAAPVPISPPEYHFDGKSTGFVVGPTLTHLDRSVVGIDRSGWGVRVAGRLATVLQLVDAELGYEHASQGSRLSRDELGVLLATHPGFPFLVWDAYASDVISGFHLFASAAVARTDGPEARVHWAPTIGLGAGLDFPLSPRGGASGLWLTLRWANRWLSVGDGLPKTHLDDQQVMLLVGWRTYTLNWARLPRPF